MSCARAERSPQTPHREQVERPVTADDRHLFELGLGGEHPVERIAVGDVVATRVKGMVVRHAELPKAELLELADPVVDERFRLWEPSQAMLRGYLPC